MENVRTMHDIVLSNLLLERLSSLVMTFFGLAALLMATLGIYGVVSYFVRQRTVELGTRNPAVRVNCILPGPVMLPPELPEPERQTAIRGTLVQREGHARHIAQAVLFLLADDFVTGVCLPVDGGRSIYAPDSAV